MACRSIRAGARVPSGIGRSRERDLRGSHERRVHRTATAVRRLHGCALCGRRRSRWQLGRTHEPTRLIARHDPSRARRLNAPGRPASTTSGRLVGVLSAGAWALLAASSLVLGAWLAATFKIPTRVVGEAMGFGAGALVSAIAYELIPHDSVSDLDIWLSFGAGAIVFYVIDGVLEHRTGRASPGQAIALGALLDGIPESIVLGIGIAVGGSVTVGFLAAVFVSNIPEALSATSALRSDMSTRSIYRLWIVIAVTSAIAGAVGYALAVALPSSDGHQVQAFAAGAVLTMLAGSMMPEAFTEGGRRVALFTALGFAIAALLSTFD